MHTTSLSTMAGIHYKLYLECSGSILVRQLKERHQKRINSHLNK